MHSHSRNERRVFWAAVLTGSFMIAEVVGGIVSGSLALLADAGHMLTDFASLALAWFAFRLSRRPSDWKRTYGFDRFQILIAFVNGITLLFVFAWVVYEAISRILEPIEILGGTMLAVAVVGLVVNLAAFWMLHGADRENLNIRGAALHVMGDLLGSLGAIAAAGIILLTGWTLADPLLSILVALLIARSAWMLIAEAGHILLEGAPRGLDVRDIAPDLMETIEDVHDVHHVHAWSITQERTLATLHACIPCGRDPASVSAAIKARLDTRFGIRHATIEIEHDDCSDDAR